MPIVLPKVTSERPGNPNNDQGPAILKIIWILTGFTTLLVIVRIYVRSVLRKIGMDDYLIIISMVCTAFFPLFLYQQILSH